MAFYVMLAASSAAFTRATTLQINAEQPSILSKRDDVSLAVRCGNFGTANGGDTTTNWYNLRQKGGTASAAAKSCSRLGCYNTSGVYLCNDQDEDIEIDLAYAMENAGLVLTNVCTGGTQDAMSGQVFTNAAGGYNIVMGYCNGNEPSDKIPSEYAFPGPNGSPINVCGFEDLGQLACDVGPCLDDAIEVTSTERVVCNEYVSDIAVAPGQVHTQSTTQSISEGFALGGMLSLNIGKLSGPLGVIGFEGSYTHTATTGSVSGGSEQCGSNLGANVLPANWTCTVQVRPSCWRFRGTCGTEHNGRMPYDMTVPMTNPATGHGVSTQDLCVCTDCEGWAEGGAPQPGCDLSCLACASGPQPPA